MKIVPVALAVTALAALAAGCGVESGRTSTASDSKCPWKPDTSIKTDASIGYQKIPNGDLVVKDLGLLEKCAPNAKIHWSNFPSGGDVIQAYGAGDKGIDIGLMGSSPATKAVSAPLNLPISVIWIHDVIGTAESLVVRDKATDDIAGLKGKKIAVPFGSTSHFSLLQALTDAGLDPNKDVTLINLEPEKMIAAWGRGDIDAAWVWDPALTQLAKTGHVILSSADTAKAGKPTYDLGTASNAFIKENPEFIDLWAKSQDYAVKQIKDDPSKAADSVAVELGVTPAEAKKLFAGLQYLPASEQAGPDWLGGKLGKDLFTTAGFLKAQGGVDAIGPEAAYAKAVDAQPAASVKQ